MVITSRDNPKVKQYCKLASGRKARAEQGLFVIEGLINCADMCALAEKEGSVRITALFLAEDTLEGYSGSLDTGAIERFDEQKKFFITKSVAEKMSGVGQSSGAFAVAEKLDLPFEADSLSPQGKYLILDDVRDPGNLGTMIRTSAALAIDGIVLTGNTVDLYNPKVVRSAMASMPRVKLFVEPDFSRVIDTLSRLGIKSCAAVVLGGESASDFDWSGGCAVVIGNEGRGLSAEDAELCSHRVTIRMNGNMESLNAATAGAILLWEMSGRGR